MLNKSKSLLHGFFSLIFDFCLMLLSSEPVWEEAHLYEARGQCSASLSPYYFLMVRV